jgi:hypothetical protein
MDQQVKQLLNIGIDSLLNEALNQILKLHDAKTTRPPSRLGDVRARSHREYGRHRNWPVSSE